MSEATSRGDGSINDSSFILPLKYIGFFSTMNVIMLIYTVYTDFFFFFSRTERLSFAGFRASVERREAGRRWTHFSAAPHPTFFSSKAECLRFRQYLSEGIPFTWDAVTRALSVFPWYTIKRRLGERGFCYDKDNQLFWNFLFGVNSTRKQKNQLLWCTWNQNNTTTGKKISAQEWKLTLWVLWTRNALHTTVRFSVLPTF